MKIWISIIVVLLASNISIAQDQQVLSKKELLATNAFQKVERIAVNADMILKGFAPIVLLDYKELIDEQMIDLSTVISTAYMDQSLVKHLYPTRADQKVIHLQTKPDLENPPIFTAAQEMPYLKSCDSSKSVEARYKCSEDKYQEILLPHCTKGTTLLQMHVNKFGEVEGFNMFKNGNEALNTFLKEWTSDPYLFMPGKQSLTFVDVYVTLELTKE